MTMKALFAYTEGPEDDRWNGPHYLVAVAHNELELERRALDICNDWFQRNNIEEEFHSYSICDVELIA